MIQHGRWLLIGALVLLDMGLAGCQRLATRPAGGGVSYSAYSVGHDLVLPARPQDTLRAHYLNVGAGMCHVIECPGAGGELLLDDCGSTDSSGGLSKDDAIAAVKGLVGVHPVIVVLSHSDADHSNYVPDIFNGPLPAGIRAIWAGGNYGNYGQAVQTWLKGAQKAGVPVRMDGFPDPTVDGFAAGWSNNGNPAPALICGAASTYVLTVNSEKGANPASMMLMLDYTGGKLILPGDATGDTQAQAVQNAVDNMKAASFLHADVVEMSHHGASSNHSNDPAWAEATIPRYLIASAGSRYGHPRCDAVQNYIAATGTRLLGAPSHDFRCGVPGGWDNTPSLYAIFGTYTSEAIAVDVSKPGVPQRVEVYCGGVKCSQ